jgi:hypothetical protein
MIRLKQFCFPSGEAIRQEGGEGDVIHRPRPADEAGVRRTETRGAGPVRPKSCGLGLAGIDIPASPNPLDPEPNSLRQNDSI